MNLSRLSLGLLFCLALGSQAQQITIRANQNAGDVYTFEQSMTMQMNLTVTANGQPPQQIQQNMSQNRAGKVQVLEATNGDATKATVSFQPNCGGFMEMVGQGRQEQPFALAGKTVNVTKQGATYQVDGGAEGSAEVENYVKIDAGMFPKQPVAPGDTWEVAPDEFTKAMQMDPTAKGSARAKLVSVDNVGGRQVANVDININIAGDQPGAGQMTMQMAGVVKIDVATGRTVGGTLTGPMTIAGQPQPGMDLKGTGQLNFAFKGSVTGGAVVNPAPVPQPVPPPVPNPNPAPNPFDPNPAVPAFAGVFTSEKLSIDVKPVGTAYEGIITMKDKAYPFTASAQGSNLVGQFKVDANSFDFTASLNGDQLTFKTGASTHELKRKSEAKNPLDG